MFFSYLFSICLSSDIFVISSCGSTELSAYCNVCMCLDIPAVAVLYMSQ